MILRMRLSACIEFLFREAPFADRIGLAAKAGAEGVEFWDWTDKDVDAIDRERRRHGIPVVSMVGARTPIVDAANIGAFLREIRDSISTAKQLECRNLVVNAGKRRDGVPHLEQYEAIVSCLAEAGLLARSAGVTLLLEPLNDKIDHPGHFLTTSHMARAILLEVADPNVRLLFDVYHQQVTEGFLTINLLAAGDLLAHVQIADCPCRREPGTGEIRFLHLFRELLRRNYEGFVGLECLPSAPSAEAIRITRSLLDEAAVNGK